jgi:hypothetical protein
MKLKRDLRCARSLGYSHLHSSSSAILPVLSPLPSSSHSPPISNMAHILSKPLALITTTTISVVSLLTAAAAGISYSTRPALRKARFVLHLGWYVGTLAVCSVLGVVYSVLLTIVGQVSASLLSR